MPLVRFRKWPAFDERLPRGESRSSGVSPSHRGETPRLGAWTARSARAQPGLVHHHDLERCREHRRGRGPHRRRALRPRGRVQPYRRGSKVRDQRGLCSRVHRERTPRPRPAGLQDEHRVVPARRLRRSAAWGELRPARHPRSHEGVQPGRSLCKGRVVLHGRGRVRSLSGRCSVLARRGRTRASQGPVPPEPCAVSPRRCRVFARRVRVCASQGRVPPRPRTVWSRRCSVLARGRRVRGRHGGAPTRHRGVWPRRHDSWRGRGSGPTRQCGVRPERCSV